MLPASHRLSDPASFRSAGRGRRAGARGVVVHLRTARPEDPSAAPARVGFVVSKAVGNAVVRNRVKRRLRHLTRDHLASLPRGGVVVVRAQPAAATASYAELGADLARCLTRVLS